MANENGIVSDNKIDADGKIPYDCTPVSRKVEGGFFPNTYSNNNLNEEIRIYQNNLNKKREKHTNPNVNFKYVKNKDNTSRSENNIIKSQKNYKKSEKGKFENKNSDKEEKVDKKENKESGLINDEKIKNDKNKNEAQFKLNTQFNQKEENKQLNLNDNTIKKEVVEQKIARDNISNQSKNDKNTSKNLTSENHKVKKHSNQKNHIKTVNNVKNTEKKEENYKNTNNFEKNKTSETIKKLDNNEKKSVEEKTLTNESKQKTKLIFSVEPSKVENKKEQISEDEPSTDNKLHNVEKPISNESISDVKTELKVDEDKTNKKVIDKTEQIHRENSVSKKDKIRFLDKVKSLFLSKNIVNNVLIVAVTILFILNIILSTIVIISIRNGGTKVVNVNNNSISVSGDGITASAVRTALDSSVCIAAGGIFNDEESFYNKSKVSGSGVIYKLDGNSLFIITCYHVIKDYKNTIYVMLSCYLKPLPASIFGYSEKLDIAVIKVNNIKNIDGFNVILQGDSQKLEVGESVFAIGNQISSGFATTSGIISKLNILVDIDGVIFREIQIDAPINHGNSGGGLFDVNGKFIGLINAKYPSTTPYVEGISYAFPGTMVLSTVDSIMRNNGNPTYIDIGVSFKHDKEVGAKLVGNKFIDDYVVRVEKVENNSDAENYLKTDDIIQSFTWIDVYGKERTTYMYNEYCFDDIKYMIKKDSMITFNVSRPIYNIDSISISFKVTNLHI